MAHMAHMTHPYLKTKALGMCQTGQKPDKQDIGFLYGGRAAKGPKGPK